MSTYQDKKAFRTKVSNLPDSGQRVAQAAKLEFEKPDPLKLNMELITATMQLAFARHNTCVPLRREDGAIVIAITLGIPAGVIAAVNRGKFFDRALMSSALIGYSMPIFWWALLLIIIFSGNLGWTPVSGRIDLLYYFPDVTGFMLIDSLLSGQDGAFVSAVRHLILPSIVLATIPLAVIARQTRSAMLEVLGEDYIRTARAKGLTPPRVNGVHALRNAMIPVITVIGLSVGMLLAGAILTETIFSWPGIGKWMVDSIYRRDYPVVQGGLLLVALLVMVVNLIVDLLYGLINPKIRKR